LYEREGGKYYLTKILKDRSRGGKEATTVQAAQYTLKKERRKEEVRSIELLYTTSLGDVID